MGGARRQVALSAINPDLAAVVVVPWRIRQTRVRREVGAPEPAATEGGATGNRTPI